MNLSPYFQDQLDSYQVEIDDLTSDTEGKDVLQRRLKDKRSEFAAIVGLLDTDPLLLAPAFHGAFSFPEERAEAVEDLLTRVPGDFRPWAEIAGQVRVAAWAAPMVALALEQAEGDDFLSLVLGLEYALTRHKGGWRDDTFDNGEAREGAEEDDGSEADAQGEDFLEQQGFDRRIPK